MNSSPKILDNEQPSPEEIPSVFYVPSEEQDSPDLLFFEERVIHDSSWKRASQKGRHLWIRLKEKYDQISCEVFAGDRFLRRMPTFRKIKVLLNRPVETSLVKSNLRRMMKDRSYHHLRWMLVDLLLLPFSVLLWIIPGPNVIGYYLLFRVISHWLSFRSASNARLDDMDIVVSERATEVGILLKKAKSIRAGLHELRRKYGLRALQEHEFIPQSTLLKQQWIKFKQWFSEK